MHSMQAALPFSQPIHLNVGATMSIFGTVSRDPYRFAINLFTSDDDRGVALHIGTRFDGSDIVINTKNRGIWEKEERAGKFPFTRGKRFIVTVVTTVKCFLVKVNGQLLHSFRHRQPFGHVKRLGVTDEANGDIPSVGIKHISAQVLNM